MRICFDGLSINQLYGTGLYTYTYELLNNLLEIYPQPKYELIWDNSSSTPLWRNVTCSGMDLNRKANDFTLLEEHLIKNKVDIYHSPNNGLSIPFSKVCKYIITVHDLSPISHNNFVDKKYYDKFMAVFPNAVAKADKIIAVSKFIAKELTSNYNIPDKKLEVIHPGCSDIFKPIDSVQAKTVLKARYGVEGNFILYAGSIHARKNLDILLKAFKAVLKYKDDLKLVIVGSYSSKREEYYLRLKQLVQKLGIDSQVLFTGIVEYTDMPCFYSGSECSLNLSDYEGFPMTTIEAMSCNSPVICSRSSSFEESAGLSAAMVDSKDAAAVKDAILGIISARNYRNTVKNSYLAQSSCYKWENAINKLAGIYESTVYGT